MAETLRDERAKPVASYSHTAALLGLMFVSLAVPFALQRHAANGVQRNAASVRPNLIPGFLLSLAFDWGIFFYAWTGVKQKGGSLAALSAGRWLPMSELLRDIGIAIPFWVVWELVAHGTTMLLAPSPAKASDVWITPRGIPEVGLWIAVSCSAGFCEEVIFRGYLLRQFGALTERVGGSFMPGAGVRGNSSVQRMEVRARGQHSWRPLRDSRGVEKRFETGHVSPRNERHLGGLVEARSRF
jgi:membrane protease YdiL (CAAX protease family)